MCRRGSGQRVTVGPGLFHYKCIKRARAAALAVDGIVAFGLFIGNYRGPTRIYGRSAPAATRFTRRDINYIGSLSFYTRAGAYSFPSLVYILRTHAHARVHILLHLFRSRIFVFKTVLFIYVRSTGQIYEPCTPRDWFVPPQPWPPPRGIYIYISLSILVPRARLLGSSPRTAAVLLLFPYILLSLSRPENYAIALSPVFSVFFFARVFFSSAVC